MSGILDIVEKITDNVLHDRCHVDSIMRYNSLRKMFLDYYHTRVFFKKLMAIEELTKEEKFFYWNQTSNYEDKDTRIEAVKVLYVLDFIATKKTNGH